MKRNTSKHHVHDSHFIISLLLCGVMAMTCAPVSVHAEEEDTGDTETTTVTDEGTATTGAEPTAEAEVTAEPDESTPSPDSEETAAPAETAEPESETTAEPEETPAATPEPDPMPAIDAEVTADNGVTSAIHAEEGTFPAGTTVQVTTASAEEAASAAEDLLGKDVVDVAAVDITFHDASGKEVEPAMVKVCR